MKTKLIITAAALLLSAGASFADSINSGSWPETHFTPTLSRAQVKQELAVARQHGQLMMGDIYPASQSVVTSNLTRNEVRAQAVQYAKMNRDIHSSNEYLGG